MHVLFITPFYAPEWKFGGPPRKISGLAKELAGRGHFLRTVTFNSESSSDDSRRSVDSIDVQYLPWVGTGLRQCPAALRPLQDQVAWADIIHCYGLYNLICPLAAWLAVRSSTPFIIEPLGMYVPRVRRILLKRFYNGVVTRWLFRRAAAIIATSELEAEELRFVGRGKVFVRRNGVTLESTGHGDRLRLRTAWGVLPNDRLIGYIGRISEKKRLLDLVDAFSKMSTRPTRLLIAGPVSESDYFEKLKIAVADSPRRGDIVIKGLLQGEEYVMAMKGMDLFVLPSENENFGNSAAEAVLADVPVLLTRDCGVAPIIDGRVGLAIDLGIDALREGIEVMLRPETKERWEPHWKKVQAELSWEEPVRIMEGIYERILEARKHKADS